MLVLLYYQILGIRIDTTILTLYFGSNYKGWDSTSLKLLKPKEHGLETKTAS